MMERPGAGRRTDLGAAMIPEYPIFLRASEFIAIISCGYENFRLLFCFAALVGFKLLELP